MPDQNDESFVQSTSRGVKNVFAGCFGFIQKSDELAKIKYKESQISGRKKQFGVEYLDLVEAEATSEQLEACLKKAQEDLKKIKDEITDLEQEIARVDGETKKKIVAKPGTTPATKEETKEEAKTEDPAATPSAPAVDSPATPVAQAAAPTTETPPSST
jgi:cell division septum initiation protein DivIVA